MPLRFPAISAGWRKQMVWRCSFGVAALLLSTWLVTNQCQTFAQRRTAKRDAEASKPSKSPNRPFARARARQLNLIQANKIQNLLPDGSLVGQPWTGATPVRETTEAIMQRASQIDHSALARTQSQERELRQPDRRSLPQHPATLPGVQWPPLTTNTNLGTSPATSAGTIQKTAQDTLQGNAQTVTLQFRGASLAESNAFPPDSMGAVGLTQFLLCINGRIRVFDKATGQPGALDATTDTFFDSVRAGAFTSDPRVRFDRLTNRWLVVMINVPASRGNNSVLLAVSDGPTIQSGSTWRFYSFPQHLVAPTGDSGCFADYPTLGVDAQALYIGANQFCGDTFRGAAGFVVRKSSVLNDGPIIVTAFRDLAIADSAGPFTPQGVDNFDPNATEGYFIGTDTAYYGLLAVRRVSNPGGTPIVSPNIFVPVLATSAPLSVRHRGNSNGRNGFLDALDDRLFAAHMRNGRLWTAHNVALSNLGTPAGSRTRNGVRWYELTDLNTNAPRLVQAGTLYAATATTNTFDERNFFIPSIMVSGQGHAALGVSVAGSNEYVNAAVAGRLASDPLGVLRAVSVYTNSTTSYNPPNNTGNDDGSRRWGDYSYTCVDPSDDMTMWTIQQYCDSADSYAVQVARLQAPPPAVPQASSPASLAAGQNSLNVTITGNNTNGAGFFDPGDGFAKRLTAQVSGGVSVNSVTYLNPTTLRLNLSTVGASAGAKHVTITNPDGQTATGNNIFTVGSCAYTVTPLTQTIAASGGNLTFNVTASSECVWTAASNAPFLTVSGIGTGSGNGTVTVNVASTVAAARTGTLTIAGQTVTINQSAGSGCALTLAPLAQSFTANASYGTLTVTTSNDCAWTATTNDAFVRVLTGASGQGNGTINFLVAENTTPLARSGAISVTSNGVTQTLIVTQEAAPLEVRVDDGSFETQSGLGAGGTSSRVNRLTPSFYPATLGAIAIHFPEGAGLNVDDSFTLLAGVNADGDTDINGTTFQEVAVKIKALGEFSVYQLPMPITINAGDFVIGMRLTHEQGATPFARDTTPPDRERSYRSLDGASYVLIKTLGTAGNYGIRAQLVRPGKLLVQAGARLTTESCQPANGAVDPGETVTVNVSVQNTGTVSAENVTATIPLTGNVAAVSGAINFGSIAPGVTVTRTITLTAGGTCGDLLTLTLPLLDGGQLLSTHAYPFRLGTAATASAALQRFTYSAEPRTIPDADERGVEIPISVSGFTGKLADLNLRIEGMTCTAVSGATTVGVAHDYVGDLVMRLVSPQGTSVTVMARPGGTNNSGRNFCQTTLDDDAPNAPSIQNISARTDAEVSPPYVGTFRPANPLAAFDGEDPNGVWKLQVADLDATATGVVRSASLLLAPFTCCVSAQPNGYEADIAPRANGNGSVSASDWTLLGRFVAGLLAPAVGSEFQRADCAPRDLRGDGQLTAADFTQAGRYAAGLDPLTTQGGPIAPSAPSVAGMFAAPIDPANSTRTSNGDTAQALTIPRNGRHAIAVALTMTATGAENALSGTLHYDATQWRLVATQPGSDWPNAQLITNQQAGKLGFLLALPVNLALAAGTRETLVLRFVPLRPYDSSAFALRLDDALIPRETADIWATPLRTRAGLPFGWQFTRQPAISANDGAEGSTRRTLPPRARKTR